MTIDWLLAAKLSVLFMISGALQGLTGFGFGMSCMAALPLLITDMRVAVPVASLAALAVLPVLVIELWRHMSWRAIGRFAVGVAVGTAVGTVALVALDQRLTLSVLAVTIILVSIRGLTQSNREAPKMAEAPKPSWLVASLLGVASGFFGAYLNTAGAPLAIYAYTVLPALGARALLTGLFCLAGIFKVFTYAYEGLWTGDVLVYGGLAIPMGVLGVRIGARLHYRLGHAGTVKVAWCALLVLGIVHGLRSVGVIAMAPAARAPHPNATSQTPNSVDLPTGPARLVDDLPTRSSDLIAWGMRTRDEFRSGSVQTDPSASPTDW